MRQLRDLEEVLRQHRDEWPRLLLQRHERRRLAHSSAVTAVLPLSQEEEVTREAFIMPEVPCEELLAQTADSDAEAEGGDEPGDEPGGEQGNERSDERETEEAAAAAVAEEGHGEEFSLLPRQCDQMEDYVDAAVTQLTSDGERAVEGEGDVEERAWKALLLARGAAEKYGTVGSYLGGLASFIAAAQACDEATAEATSEAAAPLTGVFCAYSTFFHTEDMPSTLESDVAAVEAVKEAGALCLCRSHASAMPTVAEFSTCRNPYNSDRVAGGASASEASLLATGVVSLSLSVDVQGSAKLAAAFCGTTVLHPTRGRVSDHGVHPPGGRAVPMTLFASHLPDAMRALTSEGSRRLDPTLRGKPFNEELFAARSPLRVGLVQHNGIIAPAPVVGRALEEASRSLRALGHTVAAVGSGELVDLWRLYELSLARSRALAQATTLPYQEPYSPVGQSAVRWLNAAAVHLFYLGRARTPAALWATPAAMNARELKAANEELAALQQQLEQAMEEGGLDLLLLPAYASLPPHCSPAPGSRMALPLANSYGASFDALDMPVGVLPVAITGETDNWSKREATNSFEEQALFVESDCANLPVAVQVVGRKDQDETVLRVMVEMEKELDLKAPRLLREYRMKEFFGKPDAFACVSTSVFEEQITDDII